MTTFFTSDTHFGHANIIRYCDRPFKDVDHMNAEIVRRWNEKVSPEDTVFHMGDVALGKIDESLPMVGRLNGEIILIIGNHDRIFKAEPEKKQQRFIGEYNRWFSDYYDEIEGYVIGADTENPVTVNLSHFPYDGDSHGTDRYSEVRIADRGVPLIHGHTHSSGNPVSRSTNGTLQVHVGQDAWRFAPVSEYEVHMLLLRESTVPF